MIRRILLPLAALLPALALTACNDGGLNVEGTATVTATDGTVRRFAFPEQTRLDGSSPERFTGSCILRRTAGATGDEWGAVVEIHSGGTADDASRLTSLTIMQNTGAAPEDARVEIVMGGVTFTPVAGACSVELPYALGDGVVAFSGSCQVADAENNAATVDLDLDFAGCTVED